VIDKIVSSSRPRILDFGRYKMGCLQVAYKLKLLEEANIHPVFHVSCLKAKIGQTITPLHKLPPVDSLGHLALEPVEILETRVVKKRRLLAVTEALVLWEGAAKEDAT
jgi:hypothetical protein